jgi:hypothetical protein
MLYTRIRNLFVFITLCFAFLTSCQQEFDSKKWDISIDGTYPHREKMVDNLVERHGLKGKTVQEITDLLGVPDNYYDHNPYEMTYQIVVDYGFNIDPVYSKYLVLYLDDSDRIINKSNRIIKVKIQEFDR